MARPFLNVARAAQLRASGWSWREVGILLANEEGRSMPYEAGSVYRAVRAAKARGDTSLTPAKPGRYT